MANKFKTSENIYNYRSQPKTVPLGDINPNLQSNVNTTISTLPPKVDKVNMLANLIEHVRNPHLQQNLPLSINLEKRFYGYNGALEELDEEFTEFTVSNYTPKDFFNLYDKFFYQLNKDVHNEFFSRSSEYIGGYINPRDLEISAL